MNWIPVEYFPFFDHGKEILKMHDMSINRIDNTNVYDNVITDATNDIINSFTKNIITPLNKMGPNEYEVLRFYTTLFILKSMPSATLYKYWIKTYISRLESILNQVVNNIQDIAQLFDELKMSHKFLRLEGLDMMAIKINDYLDFAILIKANEKRYQHLLMVNLPVWKGRVFISINEINNFKLIILKLAENKIHQLFDELDLQVRSNKIDSVIKQLQGYIVKDPNLQAKQQKQLEYGQVTPQMQILNDKTIEMMKALPKDIEVSHFPPCINRLLSKILEKKILNHPENILLASYLGSKGFTKEQMTDIFMLAGNADKSKIEYNLDYILEKQLKPYNCNKADEYGLCFKDAFCEKYQISNPMSYRK